MRYIFSMLRLSIILAVLAFKLVTFNIEKADVLQDDLTK